MNRYSEREGQRTYPTIDCGFGENLSALLETFSILIVVYSQTLLNDARKRTRLTIDCRLVQHACPRRRADARRDLSFSKISQHLDPSVSSSSGNPPRAALCQAVSPASALPPSPCVMNRHNDIQEDQHCPLRFLPRCEYSIRPLSAPSGAWYFARATCKRAEGTRLHSTQEITLCRIQRPPFFVG